MLHIKDFIEIQEILQKDNTFKLHERLVKGLN